jgi:hypothetical protein
MPSRVTRTELATACDRARAGDWEAAHAIVQRAEDDPLSCWIHAVLHRIEGDEGNARYWYRRAGRDLTAYPDPDTELAAIKAVLTY